MPVLPSGQTINVRNSSSLIQISKGRFIVLLSCFVSIFIVITLFFFEDAALLNLANIKVASFAEDFKNQSSEYVYPGSELQKRYIGNFDTVKLETNSQKQFLLLSRNFEILLGSYTSTHNPKIRDYLQRLSDYIKENYSSQFTSNNQKFSIPCLDTACKEIKYSTEIEEIRGIIENDNVFADQMLNKYLLDKLEEAAFVEKAEDQLESYNQVYQVILSDWRNTKNPVAEDLLNKLQKFIEGNYPDQYAVYKELGVYKLE